MISETEKKKIIEMYKAGMSKSAIARKRGRGRNKVAEVVNAAQEVPSEKVAKTSKETPGDSLDNDPEIIAAEKALRLAELARKKREIDAPLEIESRMNVLEETVGELLEDSKTADENLDTLFNKLAANPVAVGLSKSQCINCKKTGGLAIYCLCTKCYNTSWLGWK